MGIESAAAVAGIASLATTAGGAGMSFHQAGKARKMAREAEADAARMMADARAELDVNYAEALSIYKEPYTRQREALLAQGAQLTEAGKESERGAGAMAGRVLAGQLDAQGKVQDKMSAELFNLDAMKAEEDSRLRDIGVDITLQQVSGAQEKAAEMENRANIYKQQGIEGSLDAVRKGLSEEMIPLYGFGKGKNKDKVTATNNTLDSSISSIQGDSSAFDASSIDDNIGSKKEQINQQAKIEQLLKLGYKMEDIKKLVGDVDWTKTRI